MSRAGGIVCVFISLFQQSPPKVNILFETPAFHDANKRGARFGVVFLGGMFICHFARLLKVVKVRKWWRSYF